MTERCQQINGWPEMCSCTHDVLTYESRAGTRCRCCLGRTGQAVLTQEEMRAWYDRMHRAIHENEPLYVTPEEYAEIKRRFSGAPLPPATYPTAVPAAFLGTPVIIDAEKAAQQRGTP